MVKRFLQCILLACTSGLFAAPVHQFYNATVPVVSQADQIRAHAVQEALQQELIKLSGNPNIAANATIQNALQQANNYLLAYTYESFINDDGSQGLGLTVAFNGSSLTKLLTQAGQAIWGNNRPAVLVWLAMQQPSQTGVPSNNLLANNPNDVTVKVLQQDAAQYGLPIILPAMDATDQQAISFNAVWQLNMAQITQASQRYTPDAILIGRVYENGQQWFANWNLINGTKQSTWTSQGSLLFPVLKFGISLSTQVLAANYTNPAASNNTQQQITLTISNVSNVTAYAQVSNYVKQIPGVSQVAVTEVGTNSVTFSVTLSSSATAFVQALSLEHRLVPTTLATNPSELSYQWVS